MWDTHRSKEVNLRVPSLADLERVSSLVSNSIVIAGAVIGLIAAIKWW